jgi:hypothetical protein
VPDGGFVSAPRRPLGLALPVLRGAEARAQCDRFRMLSIEFDHFLDKVGRSRQTGLRESRVCALDCIRKRLLMCEPVLSRTMDQLRPRVIAINPKRFICKSDSVLELAARNRALRALHGLVNLACDSLLAGARVGQSHTFARFFAEPLESAVSSGPEFTCSGMRRLELQDLVKLPERCLVLTFSG